MSTAEQFVNIALTYTWATQKCVLPEQKQRILSEVLIQAGFTNTNLVLGQIGPCNAPTNPFCSYYVAINGILAPDEYATGWLNELLQSVVNQRPKNENEEAKSRLATFVQLAIERSIPLKPIPLTASGDFLQEIPLTLPQPGQSYFKGHSRDSDKLDHPIGIHSPRCHGQLKRMGTTEQEDVIFCPSCGLRVEIPRNIETYGQLREHFNDRRLFPGADQVR